MENPIYKFMRDNGLTKKDEATFLSEYSDPNKAAQLHKFMVDNQLTTKGADDFYNEYFSPSKKKVSTGSSEPAGQPGKPSAPSFGQKITEKIANSASQTQIPLKTEFQQEQEKRADEKKVKAPTSKYFEVDIEEKPDEIKAPTIANPVVVAKNSQKSKAIFNSVVGDKEVYKMPTRGESNQYASDITSSYLDYLELIGSDKIDTYKEKYKELKSKSKEERSSEDEEFLRQVESEAVGAFYDAKEQELFQLSNEIDNLEKIAVTEEDKQALNDLYGQYEKKRNSLIGTSSVYAQNKFQYGKIAGREMQDEEEKMQRFQELQAGDGKTVEFFKGIGSAVSNGVLSLYQVPKVFGDLIGDTDYDWADEMYDAVSGAKADIDREFGAPLPKGKTMSNLPFTARLAVVGGNAIGSAALFAAGGTLGGATSLGQSAATFGTAFLTSEADYYQEALDAGMSPQDAALTGTYLAAQTALVESIIPDIKYFQPGAFRKSVMQGVMSGIGKGLPVKEAAKLALKNTLKAIPESGIAYAKTGIKESGEELLGQVGEDLGKEMINAVGKREYFNDTFNGEAYTDAILGGFIAGGGMSVFSRPTAKSPVQEEVMREIVEKRPHEKLKGTASDSIAKEDMSSLDDATETFEAMSSHSGWKDMSREEQNHAFALAQQAEVMKKEQERMKKLRIPDEQKDAQIKQLEDEVNAMFAEQLEKQKQKKNDQENIQGLPSEVGVGQEPIAAQPVQVTSAEAPQAGGVLQESDEAAQRVSDILADIYRNVPGGRNNSLLDEGFGNAPEALNRANAEGGNQYSAHGMGKTSIASAFKDLFNLLTKGIDPTRGGGRLYTAPLSGGQQGAGAGTGTASGNAYMDGPFTLVANRGVGSITDVSQIGGIIVNDGLVDARPELLDALRQAFPNIVFESTSNTDLLVRQLNARSESQQATQTEAAPQAQEEEVIAPQATEEAAPVAEEVAPEPQVDNKSVFRILEKSFYEGNDKRYSNITDEQAKKISPDTRKYLLDLYDRIAPFNSQYQRLGKILDPQTSREIVTEDQKIKYVTSNYFGGKGRPSSQLGSPLDPKHKDLVFPVPSAKVIEDFNNILGAKISDAEAAALQVPKTQAAPKVQEQAAPKAATQVQEQVTTEVAPKTEEKPTRKTRLAKLFETSEGEEAVPLIEQSLSESGIKVDVKDDADYNNDDRIKRSQGRGSEGMFVADDGTIILNRDKIKGEWGKTIVFHEGIHPVVNIIRNTDPKRYRAIVDGLKAEAARNNAVAKAAADIAASEEYQRRGPESIEDETVVETMARVATGDIDINTFKPSFREKFIEFMNDIAKAFGLRPILTNSPRVEVKRLADQLSKALNEGGKISDVVGKKNVTKFQNTIGTPTSIVQPSNLNRATKVKVNPKGHSLSFVQPSDIKDISSLIKEIADKDQKVWFWVADQLGRGLYFDSVIDGYHFLDAGPSFALDPENRKKNIIWATGKNQKEIEKLMGQTDYIFIISGSPQLSKLFNKKISEIVFNRIEKATMDRSADKKIDPFNKFKKEILGVSKVSSLNSILNSVNSFDELLNSPKRKQFLIAMLDQQSKQTPLKKLFEKYNAFVDLNEFRDGFYADNNFELNDIMLVLKPTGFGGTSKHSTYENDVLGEVVGVPDRKINAYDIMTDEFKSKYGEIPRTQQQQTVAPYGIGVRSVQPSKGIKRGGNLVKDTYYEAGLTEDKNDYVFFHVSSAPKASIMKGIDSTKYTSLRTAREEKGLQYGVASYYTRPEDGERMVGGDKYAVRVPKGKVYPIDSDPMGYGEMAEENVPQGTPFRGEAVKREIADMAKKDGYQMMVGEWSYSRTGKPAGEIPEFRADALVPLKPTAEKPTSFTSNAEKGMERIPFPSQQSEQAKQELENIASEVSDIMSNKKKFSSKEYQIANDINMSGQVRENRNEDNEFKRDITPEEYDMMVKVLPKGMQAEAARVRGLLFGGKKKGQASKGIARTSKEFAGNVGETIDRIKVATSEDGATLNLDGTTYEDGGLVVPAGSLNVAQDEVTAEGLFEFLKDNEENISSDIFKIGLYKFPDRPEVSYDLNIVIPREYRDVALKFGELSGQESLFDLDTFENIKTGSDGKNPRKFTAQELADIAKDLSEGRLPKIVSKEEIDRKWGEKKMIALTKRDELGTKADREIAAYASKFLNKFGPYTKANVVQIMNMSAEEKIKLINDTFEARVKKMNPAFREPGNDFYDQSVKRRDEVLALVTKPIGQPSMMKRNSAQNKRIDDSVGFKKYFVPNIMGGVDVYTPENYLKILNEFVETGAVSGNIKPSSELSEKQFPLEFTNGITIMRLRDNDDSRDLVNEEIERVKNRIRVQPSVVKRTPAQIRQAVEDGVDAVEAAIAEGMDPQQAVDENISNQDWYGDLNAAQKEQLNEILQDEFGATASEPKLQNNAQRVADLWEKGGKEAKAEIKNILETDPELSYIYNNFPKITKQLQEQGLLTKTENCP